MKKSDTADIYVMYGFKKSDINQVGFLKSVPTSSEDKDFLTDDIYLAKRFPSKNVESIVGFGEPKKWLDYINEEFQELFHENAFKFHLVKTNIKVSRAKKN